MGRAHRTAPRRASPGMAWHGLASNAREHLTPPPHLARVLAGKQVASHEPTLPLHLFESYGEGAATTANGAAAAAAVLAAAADGRDEAEAGADATYVTATVLDVRPSAIIQGAATLAPCGNQLTPVSKATTDPEL